MHTEQALSLGVVLLITLSWMHDIAELLLEHPLRECDVGKSGLEVVNHPPHVVHEASVVHPAGLHLEAVELGKVVVLLDLPELVPETCAVPVVSVEYHRLARGDDFVVSVSRSHQPCVVLRIGVVDPHKDIKQVVPLLSRREAAHHEVTVHLV